MPEFVTLSPKTYSYLTNDNDEDKNEIDLKKCVIKQKLKFEDYKYCLEVIQLQKFKKCHTKTTNFNKHLRRRIKYLNYQMNHILYQIFKSITNI